MLGAASIALHSSIPLTTQISEHILLPTDNIPYPFQGDNLKSCAVTPVIPAASSGPNTALMLKLSSSPKPHPLSHRTHNGRIGTDNYNDFLKFSNEDMNQKYSMNLFSEIIRRAMDDYPT